MKLKPEINEEATFSQLEKYAKQGFSHSDKEKIAFMCGAEAMLNLVSLPSTAVMDIRPIVLSSDLQDLIKQMNEHIHPLKKLILELYNQKSLDEKTQEIVNDNFFDLL